MAKRVYAASGNEKFGRDYGLSKQIRKAIVSVMSNIAEGFARGGNKEFMHFLYMARGSLAESNSQLYLARDLDYIDDEVFSKIDSGMKQLSRRLTAFINSMEAERR